MRSLTLLACSLLGLGLASAADAPVTADNPTGKTYKATLLDKDSTGIRGTVKAIAGKDGEGVVFNVDFFGFPEDSKLGPYSYHIHEKPVPADGNCTLTGSHLDPFGAGEKPPCDPSKPASCQVGDLSGKHGKITDIPADAKHYIKTYTDSYASIKPGDPAFFGNRSIVVHFGNGTRANCGNFELSATFPTNTSCTGGPSGTGVTPPTLSPSTTSSPPPFNAAVQTGVSSVALVLAAVVGLLW